jgi:outer membrane protein TolC
MRKIAVFLTILIFAAGQSAWAASLNRVLTLDSSIQSAMLINPIILAQYQALELAKEKLNEAKALYLPTVDFNFTVAAFDIMAPLISMHGTDNSPNLYPAEYRDSYFITRLTFWYPIYAGGRVSTTNKLAQLNKSKNELQNEVVKAGVLFRVKTAFNDVHFYKEKLAYLKTLPFSSANNDNIDKTALEYEKKYLDLLNAIGLELNTIAEISGNFRPLIISITLERCLTLAYQYKPELLSTQYEESTDQLVVSLLSTQRYPTVFLSAAQEWAGAGRIIGDDSSWYVSMNVSIPIFDGGGLFSRIRQGKISVAENNLERTVKEDNIRIEVYKAYLDYNYYKKKALTLNLIQKTHYNSAELEIIRDLNDSYYRLEYAIGVQLDQIYPAALLHEKISPKTDPKKPITTS